MATITRSSAANLLIEGIKKNFGTGYKNAKRNYLTIFDNLSSDGETEQYQEKAQQETTMISLWLASWAYTGQCQSEHQKLPQH